MIVGPYRILSLLRMNRGVPFSPALSKMLVKNAALGLGQQKVAAAEFRRKTDDDRNEEAGE